MDYKNINKTAWDNRTVTHVKSKFYDVDGFRAGKSTLNKLELNLLGNVKDKSLLHLQCHFGMDTLSFARLGANVTGVDISSAAIEQGNALKTELDLQAQFICADIYDFAKENKQQFDHVFTSYGVLCWLHDLKTWAQMIKRALKPGGEFHLVEFHPFADVLMGYPYFSDGQALVEQEGTYTENCDGTEHTIMTWAHTLSDVINALIGAGLNIKQVVEYASSPYDCFEDMTQMEDGSYCIMKNDSPIPLLFSIKATL